MSFVPMPEISQIEPPKAVVRPALKKPKKSLVRSASAIFEPKASEAKHLKRSNSQILPSLSKPGGRMEIVPNPDPMDPPEPIIVTDVRMGTFGIRCVCTSTEKESFLVRCSKCGYYLHGACVGIARGSRVKYACPYCTQSPIRCSCDRNKKYDEPIIRCTVCGFFSHKSCAKLLFGIDPIGFVCSLCSQTRAYEVPTLSFSQSSKVPDVKCEIAPDRQLILKKIPEGGFKERITKILEKSEISFRQMLESLVHDFAPTFFDLGREFWKSFVFAISEITSVDRKDVLTAIDELFSNLLYCNQPLRKISGTMISESISTNLKSANLPKLEAQQPDVELYIDTEETVHTKEPIEDGSFICQVSGLLCHQDEVCARHGIPRGCLPIPDTQICIDSSSVFVSKIRKSFQFNCLIKLLRINGEPRVCLYATRMRGPLADEKMGHGPAIEKEGELFLPFDTDLPFPSKKVEWKIKKSKPPLKTKPKPKSKAKVKLSEEIVELQKIEAEEKHKVRNECNVKLTLLSSFVEDVCPPLPFVIQDGKAPSSRIQMMLRERHKTRAAHSSDSENFL